MLSSIPEHDFQVFWMTTLSPQPTILLCICDKFNKGGSDVHDFTSFCRSDIVNGRIYKYDNRPSPNVEGK